MSQRDGNAWDANGIGQLPPRCISEWALPRTPTRMQPETPLGAPRTPVLAAPSTPGIPLGTSGVWAPGPAPMTPTAWGAPRTPIPGGLSPTIQAIIQGAPRTPIPGAPRTPTLGGLPPMIHTSGTLGLPLLPRIVEPAPSTPPFDRRGSHRVSNSGTHSAWSEWGSSSARHRSRSRGRRRPNDWDWEHNGHGSQEGGRDEYTEHANGEAAARNWCSDEWWPRASDSDSAHWHRQSWRHDSYGGGSSSSSSHRRWNDRGESWRHDSHGGGSSSSHRGWNDRGEVPRDPVNEEDLDADLNAALVASRADRTKVGLLMELGISEHFAKQALEACANDTNAAAEWAMTRDVKVGGSREVTLSPNSIDAPTESAPASASLVGDCIVCMAAPAEYAVVPCGHQCLCSRCHVHTRASCPVCRGVVEQTMKIFLAT